MQINTVIFDLDNTILNRRQAFRVFAERFISKYVFLAKEEEKDSFISYMILADKDGYRKKRELFEDILSSFRFKDPVPSIDVLLEYWFSEFPKCAVLMEGALEVLEYLKTKQIKLGIITNGSVRAQSSKLDHVSIRDYFVSVVISDEVGVKKPDKRIFEIALNQLNADLDKTIFIGDQPLNDVVGAENVGIRGIWLSGFSEWNISDRKPFYTIDRLTELKGFLEGIS